MQFSTIFTTLMAAAAVSAVAIPTGSSGDSCTINDSTTGKKVCCSSLLGGITCLIGICDLTVLGGSNQCCEVNQLGLINIGGCIAA
ncbi:hypothetical protein BZA05DRAFT_388887 [Tricharina praecox]|uniref:uncharacterized protein n=1 Tax=Tricharina praecox TaxID=43433 RepID=UPI002220A950|nr:uncharacterized protein BZA05DRAFT_388887 [Tricharina praecox]KAI5856526.1 hypothetical protein BZA05DRAFT_388887 [Tricharina praecox]